MNQIDLQPWLDQYPSGVPYHVDFSDNASLLEMFEKSFAQNSNQIACEYLGKEFSYSQIYELSTSLATHMQSIGLAKGARIAIMLPNTVQYLISMIAVLRAGFVIVNVNPMYTSRELGHQLVDSGASLLIVLENFAHVFEKIHEPHDVTQVIVTSVGELLGIKGRVVDFVLRNIKKAIPKWSIPNHIRFTQALLNGKNFSYAKPQLSQADIAFLQYTGGTTGVSKGATLTHANILANLAQVDSWLAPALKGKPNQQLKILCPLPLYHIFALTVCAMFGIKNGSNIILIPNPRDIPGFVKLLKKHPEINIFPGVNTLFNALIHYPEFSNVKLPHLLITIAGGMAMQKKVADRWQEMMGVPVIEGYGLSETSPVACVNSILIEKFTGHIGVPVPSTAIKIVGDDGNEVAYGLPGEIWIKGPQVMSGYWSRPEETANSITHDGYFKSGDIGVMDSSGYIKIIDRKKDMIVVSGFNVFPNELEEVISTMPGVLECAVVGYPDENTGEAVKVFIARSDPNLTASEVEQFCKQEFTNYKRPKSIVFIDQLPKSNVGKILRRELRYLS